MNARQLIEGAEIKIKRKRRIIQYSSSSESENQGIEEIDQEEEQDERIVNFEIGKTTKGRDVLWFDGFRFIVSKKCEGKVYWRCEKWRQPIRCGVTAITNGDDYQQGIIKPSKSADSHNHLPKACGQEVEHRLNIFKKQLTNDLDIPTTDLIDSVKQTDDDELFTQLPSHAALARLGAKKRNAFGQSLNAENAAAILIPAEFRIKDGKRFLVYDSAENRPNANDRVLAFASDKAISFLRQFKDWAADSTFMTCPRQFAQQFVIGFFIKQKLFPAVHILMSNRTKMQYLEVLNGLKNVLGDDMPNSVLTDFEKPEYNAFAEVFPNSTNTACLFHLAQSFIRRVRKLGLIGQYKTNEQVRRTVRWCQSLAFLPPELVRRGFGLTIEQSPPILSDFLFYVGKNYIGLSEWEWELKSDAFLPEADENRMMAGLVGHSTPIAHTIDSAIVRSFLTNRRNETFETSIEMPANPTRFNENHVLSRHELPLAKHPKFPIDLWNVRERVDVELPRCQASGEANNLAFQKKIAVARGCTNF